MSELGNKKIFAKNLNYYMLLNNKNRRDISKALDIPYTTVTSWCTGEFYPRIDKIEMLANYFCINKSDLVEDNKERNNAVPLLGIVKAGYDYLAEQNIVGYVEVNVKDKENCFALKVKGDSMQPVLYEGDIIIVRKQEDIESGQVAVVLINDNEATVKKVIKNSDSIELIAFNSYYPSKKLKEGFSIIGKVIEAKISKIFE